MPTMPLSFLDLVNIESGSTSTQTLQQSTELAQVADRLGYHRYWFAEHHNAIGLASGSPEIMIAHVAAQTQRIRVGSGGVMLPNHAPLRIAEAFHLLEALHPGRIDLGLGRAPGTDPVTTYALRRSQEAMGGDDYPQLLAELLAFEDGDFPENHPFGKIKVTPADVALPPIWLLGSSAFSGDLAARVGLGFSFAAHINPASAGEVMRAYRKAFTPSPYLNAPHSILAVSVVVGDTQEQADDLYQIVKVGMAQLVTGKPYQMPTLEQARAYQFSPAEIQRLGTMMPNAFVGTSDVVAEKVRAFAAECQADEVMITSMLPNPVDRTRIIDQMAARWGLTS
ncbi:MAG: LLM class flavin-dependent oxidoreductase [Thermomicrobiales bacterium]